MDATVVSPPRPIDLGEERTFRVGDATIDPVSRDAQFAGGSERLQPQNLKVLIALARQPGKVVTRDELVGLCWEGRFIGDDVINRAISTLRQFAERAGGFSIETIPRAGYRLVEARARPKHIVRRWISVAALVLVIALVGTFALLNRNRTAQQTLTVAILPFASDPADATTRQVASQTRNSLAHMLSDSGLAVKLLDSPPPADRTIADLVISGDVHSNSNGVFATVWMEDTAHRVIVLSHRFQAARPQAASLPDQVGANVAGSLSWTARLILLDRRHPSDPAVTAELFKQIDLENVDVLRAYEFARAVAPKAPNSILAQLLLAFNTAFALDGLPANQRAAAVLAARRAADRARTLAPEFGDAYAVWCLLHSPVRMTECEDRLRAGMTADPDAPFVGHFLSELMTNVGRNSEALEEARLSLAHDQYVPTKIGHMIRLLEATGNAREAVELFRQSSRWFPQSDVIFWQRVAGIIERGDFSAIKPLEIEQGQANLPAYYEPVPALVAAMEANSLPAARQACPRREASESFKSIQCMLALARLGDLDGAFAFADPIFPPRLGRTPTEEQALWLRNPWSTPTSVITSRAAAPMRRDLRYIALARRVGLLDYWRAGRLPDFCRTRPEPICAKILARS